MKIVFIFFIIFAPSSKVCNMKKLYVLLFAASLSTLVMAQEKFELGKPNDDNYRYLDEYKALKEYIDYSMYPNFKLGAGTTVDDYLKKTTVYKMTNANFSETVAGNAMKMASCVDGNGKMNFTKVKNYVNAATEAGLHVYGHTLAWHSQQPTGWLLRLIADKPDPDGGEEYMVVSSKDFRKEKNVGWKADETENGYKTTFDATNGLKVTTTQSLPWQVQFVVMENITLEAGKTFKMTMTVKGSEKGKLEGHLGDWGSNNDGDSKTGTSVTVPFTSEWQDVEVSVIPTMDINFLLLHVPNFVGDVYIKNIQFEGNKIKTIPQTQQERHDTLVYAMDLWIKGMMEACDGKVKAWDLGRR